MRRCLAGMRTSAAQGLGWAGPMPPPPPLPWALLSWQRCLQPGSLGKMPCGGQGKPRDGARASIGKGGSAADATCTHRGARAVMAHALAASAAQLPGREGPFFAARKPGRRGLPPSCRRPPPPCARSLRGAGVVRGGGPLSGQGKRAELLSWPAAWQPPAACSRPASMRAAGGTAGGRTLLHAARGVLRHAARRLPRIVGAQLWVLLCVDRWCLGSAGFQECTSHANPACCRFRIPALPPPHTAGPPAGVRACDALRFHHTAMEACGEHEESGMSGAEQRLALRQPGRSQRVGRPPARRRRHRRRRPCLRTAVRPVMTMRGVTLPLSLPPSILLAACLLAMAARQGLGGRRALEGVAASAGCGC